MRIELSENNAKFHEYRGVSKLLLRDYDGAISEFAEAKKMTSESADAYASRGRSKQVQGDYNGAILDYDKVADLSDANAAVYLNRGYSKIRTDDLPVRSRITVRAFGSAEKMFGAM